MGANGSTRRFIVLLLNFTNNSAEKSLKPPLAAVILRFARSFHIRHLNWKQIVIVDELDARLTTGSISKRHEKATTTGSNIPGEKCLLTESVCPFSDFKFDYFYVSNLVETWLIR